MTDLHMPSPVTIALGLILIVSTIVWVTQPVSLRGVRKDNNGSRMRQIVMAMICYTVNDPTCEAGPFPLDLPSLVAFSDGELVPKVFKDPAHPSIIDPYLYVRPYPNAPSSMPVLVADPACCDGRGSMVAYADGHVDFVEGRALWDEARRLSVLPKATAGGIELADWTTLPRPVR